MKMKKYFSVLFIVAMILIPSASAFAGEVDSTVSPTAIGVGDTRNDAISLIFNGNSNVAEYSLFLQNNSDQDWFKWTNTTDETRLIRIDSLSGGSTASRLGVQYGYSNGSFSSLIQANTSGESSSHTMSNIPVPPGATIYIVVDAPALYGVQQYKLVFYDFGSL